MSTIRENIKINLNGNKIDLNIEQYNSADDVVADCRNRKQNHKEYDVSGEDYDVDWHGVGSYNEALEMLRLGYQPTVDKLKTELKASVMGNGKRVRFENNVYGFAPVVPLAMQGIPNNMINMTMKPMKCKVVDVYYDMGVNAFTSPSEIIKAGQKLLGVIINLEKQGYRFNLYAVQAYSSNNTADMLCVKVKSADKPLDLKRISFPLTHPAFFRVIGFDWQGKSPVARYRGTGRGRALTSEISNSDAKEFAKQAFGNNAVYLSCNSMIRTDENYLKEVLTNVNK